MGTKLVCSDVRFVGAYIDVTDVYPVRSGLTDLIYPRVDAATAALNHATGGGAVTVEGAPVYSALYATFPATARLKLATVDDTNDVTLVGVFRAPTNVTAVAPGPGWVLSNYGAPNSHTLGLYASADELIGFSANSSAGHNVRTTKARTDRFVFAALRQSGGVKSLSYGRDGDILSVQAAVVRTHGSAIHFSVGADPVAGNIDGVCDIALAAVHKLALTDADIEDLYDVIRFDFDRAGLEIE